MKRYDTRGFGFRLSTGFRWPQMGVESFFFMLPSRSGLTQSIADEGIEVTFSIEESCFPRLEQDDRLLLFVTTRRVTLFGAI